MRWLKDTSNEKFSWDTSRLEAVEGYYEIQISLKNDYILVTVRGNRNYQNSYEIFEKIVKACEKFNLFYVLVVSEMTPISTGDGYNHKIIFKEVGITLKHRIAWVDKNPESLKMDRFIENVLVNRGLLNGRVFGDIEFAKKWLLK